jgi:hypothetical protein
MCRCVTKTLSPIDALKFSVLTSTLPTVNELARTGVAAAVTRVSETAAIAAKRHDGRFMLVPSFENGSGRKAGLSTIGPMRTYIGSHGST